MASSVGVGVYLRTTDDRRKSSELRQEAASTRAIIKSAAERIKRLNEIYRERLEGRRHA